MSDAGDLVELSEEERQTIDAIYERRLTSTHYEILGVPRDAERRAIRDAYFALSQRFHPDVFFKRSLGPYRARIDELFRVLTRAYDVLGNARHRAGYDLHIASLESPSRPPPPAVPEVQDILATAARRAAATHPNLPSVDGSPRARSGIALSSQPSPPASSAPPAPNPPPPMRTAPRPVMPPMGTAVVPHAPVTPAAAPPAAAKMTPSLPLQPLDPDTLRRARESMARRLSSAMPGGPRPPGAPPARPSSPGHAPAPAARGSTGQAPQVDRAASVSQLVQTAEEAQKKGDFTAAADALKQALAMKKDDEALRLRYEGVRKLVVAQQVDTHINQAREAMRDGQAQVAAQHWERAWEGRPTDYQLLLNAAEVLGKYTREHKRATDLAQRVVMAEPNNVKAHVLLATVFMKAGLKASARASIESVMRLDPTHASLKELREKFGPMNLAEQLGLRNR
jgi:tetratricopeptide (TPR) repeat protein